MSLEYWQYIFFRNVLTSLHRLVKTLKLFFTHFQLKSTIQKNTLDSLKHAATKGQKAFDPFTKVRFLCTIYLVLLCFTQIIVTQIVFHDVESTLT